MERLDRFKRSRTGAKSPVRELMIEHLKGLLSSGRGHREYISRILVPSGLFAWAGGENFTEIRSICEELENERLVKK